jgi:lysine-N-methylase
MRTRLLRPEYAERFRCISPTCEDSCCVGWRVDIDKATYMKYQSISPGSLRVLIDANIVLMPTLCGRSRVQSARSRPGSLR